jgi:Reverse transcriptase (RNA-dependent DNA polymerase)
MKKVCVNHPACFVEMSLLAMMRYAAYLFSETPRPRFADDFVVSFQFREDADHFQQRVREQFAEFGLELAEEKTRRILFGRFAEVTCLRHGLGRPETFEFLGSSMSVGRIEQGDLL